MSGGISEEDIQKVREASDLVAVFGERVTLTQRGKDMWCCCPFHNEKTPSCRIDAASQYWHCFGCGEGGDVFSFIMKMDDVSFPDAVRLLAQRAHIEIQETGGQGVSSSKKARLRDICTETAAFYHLQLMRGKSNDAQQARNYLSGRSLGGDIPKRWQLGFAPGRQSLVRLLSQKGFKYDEMIEANVAVKGNDGRVRDRFFNRIMFPIFDPQGSCIAFGGRVVGKGEPKYLNSQETPLFHKSNVLYGLDKAKGALTSTGVAIIVEGYTDVIALHEAGVTNAVATLGTALTLQHIRLIGRYASKKIVYLFDGDAAGQRAADRALGFIDMSMTPEAGKTRTELCAVTLPDDLDPADFVLQRGADALREYIDNAQPLVAYGIQRRLAAHDLSTAEGRTRALADALQVLAPIKESLLAKDYAVQLAGKLKLREEDVLAALSNLASPKRADSAQDVQSQSAPAVQRIAFTDAELNRRRFERELLALCAQNTELALVHADALAKTQWHDPIHTQIAEIMLEVLADDPSSTPAQLLSRITKKQPRAAAILTSAQSLDQNVETVTKFLVDELAIGDLDDAISALKSQLADSAVLSEEDRDIMFQSVVELQKNVNQLRAAHKLPL